MTAGIGFMGKAWDDPDTFPVRHMEREPSRGKRLSGSGNPTVETGFAKGITGLNYSKRGRDAFIAFLAPRLAECLRLAKPGARLLCWAIPRTSHWTGTAIEDAGWIIEDRLAHIFAQGFPKARSKLKPACEDWWMARKPGEGVPDLNIDDCRIHSGPSVGGKVSGGTALGQGSGWNAHNNRPTPIDRSMSAGRWPANLLLDEEAAALLDEMSGERKVGDLKPYRRRNRDGYSGGMPAVSTFDREGDSGGASRFFFCSKASRADRGEGNGHPCVKPHDLMRWLCRLITPPGGTILDPFAGSGSTGKAAVAEGFGFIGIEQSAEYHAVAARRIAAARPAPLLWEARA